VPEQTRRVEAPPFGHFRPESFVAIEANAREVLRQRGYNDQQIENELHRPKRAEFDD
jgi:hypothetical protein